MYPKGENDYEAERVIGIAAGLTNHRSTAQREMPEAAAGSMRASLQVTGILRQATRFVLE